MAWENMPGRGSMSRTSKVSKDQLKEQSLAEVLLSLSVCCPPSGLRPLVTISELYLVPWLSSETCKPYM